MKLTELTERAKVKKEKQDVIKKKYRDKEKIKALTDKERIARIEELLNI